MILNCNSCGKKFVIPDNAITASGRLVQCGSCGNKWKQFPINEKKQTQSISSPKKLATKPRKIQQNTQKLKKTKRSNVRKAREINLYSPEYLAKKHGIKLSEDVSPTSSNNKISFGFYNSLIVSIVFIILILRLLYFFRDFIEFYLPSSEVYINYTFETLKNIKDILLNLF